MQAWGLTDPGCVRVQNQDAYQIHQFEEDSLLCAVCDGMAGPNPATSPARWRWMYSSRKSSACASRR